jgi:hypothetical protein
VRAAGPQPEGTPTAFTVEVTNQGPGPAADAGVDLYSGGPEITWAPERGTVDPATSRWVIGALAPGETVRLRGSTAAAAPVDPVLLSARVSGAGVDFDEEDDTATVHLSAAPAGTADVRVSRLTASRGPGRGQRTLRATVTNAGPVPAGADADHLLTVTVTRTPDARAVAISSPGGRWACSVEEWYASCRSATPLAPGASVTVTIVLEGTFPAGQPRPGVQVDSNATIDPDLGNNARYVSVVR